MKHINTSQANILTWAFVVLILISFFPPRRINITSTVVTPIGSWSGDVVTRKPARVFLLSSQLYSVEYRRPIELDLARMFAEWMIVLALAGIGVLAVRTREIP